MNTQSATDRGFNPFRGGGATGPVAGEGASAFPYDPRAKGVDGDMLDVMLKGRFQEGLKVGRKDGVLQAQARYPDVYDDGFAKGHEIGALECAEEIGQGMGKLVPITREARAGFTDVLTLVEESLNDASDGAREPTATEEQILEICRGQVTVIGELLDDVLDGSAVEEQERGGSAPPAPPTPDIA